MTYSVVWITITCRHSTALEDPSEGVVISSYEEMVRQYVVSVGFITCALEQFFIIHVYMALLINVNCVAQEGYLTEAQQYAQETELSRRVRDWEERIVPVLSQEVN